MSFFRLKIKFSVFVCVLLALQQTYANPSLEQNFHSHEPSNIRDGQMPEIPLDVQQKVISEYFEQQLKRLLAIFNKVDYIREHLAQVVNNNKLRSLKNNKQIIMHLRSLGALLQDVRKNAFVVVEPQMLKTLTAIAYTITKHLDQLIVQDLQTIPHLDLDAAIKRALSSDDVNFELLDRQITMLEKQIERIDRASNNVGISTMNRLYRSVEKFCNDHNILRKAGYTALASFIAYYFISRSHTDTLNKIPGIGSYLTKFRDTVVGQAPRYNTVTGQLLTENENASQSNQTMRYSPVMPYNPMTMTEQRISEPATNKPNQLGPLTRIEHQVGQGGYGLINLTFPAIPVWMLLYDTQIKPNIPYMREWANNKWELTRCYLRGEKPKKINPLFAQFASKTTFDDIIGNENNKSAFRSLVEFMANPTPALRKGTKPQYGWICAGATRTGKTFMVEALRGEIQKEKERLGISGEVNFFPLNAAFVRANGGIGAVIHLVKNNSKDPSIIFIDEVDMMGLQRDQDKDGLCSALTGMSGITDSENDVPVIVIAATNLPESLDQALMQYGRFGKVVWFDYPTLQERIMFLQRELEQRGIVTISPTFIEKMAKETEGCSFEELRAILITALQKSSSKLEILQETHLEEALDSEIRRIVFDEHVALTDTQKRVIATHLAGQALITTLLDTDNQICKVTIRPITREIKEQNIMEKYISNDPNKNDHRRREIFEFGKIFTLNKPRHQNKIKTHIELLTECKTLLAGFIAEKLIFGSSAYTYHKENHAQALDIARSIVFEGLAENQYPKQIREELSKKAFDLLKTCEQDVETLLSNHKDTLVALAQALQERLTLNGTEIESIIKNKNNSLQ